MRRPSTERIVRTVAAIVLLASVVSVTLIVVPGSPAFRSRQPLRFQHLSSGGYRFLNYDGDRSMNRNHRDFPITVIFYRNATMSKVKNNVINWGGNGSIKWEPYKSGPSAHKRIRYDSGRKSPCRGARDTHFRVYGSRTSSERFDAGTPGWGYFVVASTHFDFGESQCSRAEKRYGYSEQAASDVTSQAGLRGYNSGYHQDYVQTHNREKLRRVRDHIWENDGKASVVRVP